MFLNSKLSFCNKDFSVWQLQKKCSLMREFPQKSRVKKSAPDCKKQRKLKFANFCKETVCCTKLLLFGCVSLYLTRLNWLSSSSLFLLIWKDEPQTLFSSFIQWLFVHRWSKFCCCCSLKRSRSFACQCDLFAKPDNQSRLSRLVRSLCHVLSLNSTLTRVVYSSLLSSLLFGSRANSLFSLFSHSISFVLLSHLCIEKIVFWFFHFICLRVCQLVEKTTREKKRESSSCSFNQERQPMRFQLTSAKY